MMPVIMRDDEAAHFAAAIRLAVANYKEARPIIESLDALADILNPPPAPGEPNRSSHQS